MKACDPASVRLRPSSLCRRAQHPRRANAMRGKVAATVSAANATAPLLRRGAHPSRAYTALSAKPRLRKQHILRRPTCDADDPGADPHPARVAVVAALMRVAAAVTRGAADASTANNRHARSRSKTV